MKGNTFERLGAFAVRRRWFVIAAWVVLLVSMGAMARGLNGRLVSGGFEVPGSPSLSVQHDLEDKFVGQYTYTALVVIHSNVAKVSDPAFQSALAAVEQSVKSVDGVGSVVSVRSTGSPLFVSADQHTTYLVAGLAGTQTQVLDSVGLVMEANHRLELPGFEVETGGSPAFYQRFNEVSRQDLEKAERISFPITLLVLIVAFGTVVAAGLPIALGLASLVVTLGLLYFLAGVTQMSVYVTNTASIIGIGVGIDYSLFVVTRFREELKRGQAVGQAVVRAVASSGRAVALSGATVIVALAGMFLVNIQAFRSMAVGSMSVVAVAVIAAVTLLPAILSVTGRWVDRLPPAVHRAPHGGRRDRLLAPMGHGGHAQPLGLGRRVARDPAHAGGAVRLDPPRPARPKRPAEDRGAPRGHRAAGEGVRRRRDGARGDPGRHPERAGQPGKPREDRRPDQVAPGGPRRGERAQSDHGAARRNAAGVLRPALQRRSGRPARGAAAGGGRHGELDRRRQPRQGHRHHEGVARVLGGRGADRPDPEQLRSTGRPGRGTRGSADRRPSTWTWTPCRSCC